ncbi:MAG: NAD(P)/FAD-dependent oxidoreductase [Bacteroidota bacterium]
MKKVNYIVVGQGIAGTVLAQTLLKHGKSVVVIDDQRLSKASRIAAGLYNPVVFKRLVKSWMADELIPFMDVFYTEAEQLLNTKFYFAQQIVKPFAEEQEKVLWLKKINEDVGKYLGKEILTDFLTNEIHNPLGACEIIKAGNLDTSLFLGSFRNYFKKNNYLLEEKFECDQLIISEKSVSYKDLTADKIIFCEGYKSIDNPYFNWLPFKLTKGEILTVRVPLLHPDSYREGAGGWKKVINKGIFILPLGNHTYKVGATYEWNDLTEQPTEKGKAELIDKLQKVLKVPFEVIDHQAGIRPTVIDRRPLMGLHPKHPALGVFNGMGTKGVMLAPYFANHFYDFLENNIPLDIEVDIARTSFIYR